MIVNKGTPVTLTRDSSYNVLKTLFKRNMMRYAFM